MSPPSSFRGFGEKAVPFLRALGFHQDRDWFRDNRALYDSAILAPLTAFVTDLSEACAAHGLPLRGSPKTSMYRVYRDVRFAKDKSPFNTHASAILTRSGAKSDPGCFYIHISPDECFWAAGFYQLEPPRLAAVRAAMVAAPERFEALTATLAGAGLAFDTRWSLKRPPREAAGLTDARLIAALKLTSQIVTRPIAPETIVKPDLIAASLRFIEGTMPLLDYGWDALARLEPARS